MKTKEQTLSQEVPIFILAGGLGTRLSEETLLKPKPMVEIGGVPILIHIMRSYYAYGFNDFVICAGYRAAEIKKYFLDYHYIINNLEIDLRSPGDHRAKTLGKSALEEKWRVRIIDTGKDTQTGGRLARAFDFVSSTQKFSNFGLTYGDGLSDVNLTAELEFHSSHGRIGTVLGVKNLARYGELKIADNNVVDGFLEKPQMSRGWISGGFFFFSSQIRSYLSDASDSVLEKIPLESLAKDGELRAYCHNGFWHAMDALRDKNNLEQLWSMGEAPWAPRSQNVTENDLHHGRKRVLRLRTR